MGKLNPELAEQIRQRVAAGEKQKALAAEFGVSPPTIWQIVHDRTRIYSDQPRPPRQPRSRGLSATAARVLSLFAHRRTAISRSEVVAAIGISQDAASAALRGLRDRGLIEMVGRYHEIRYRLTRPAVALSAPRGDRPRHLGFGSHLRLLREQAHAGEIVD